VITNTTQTMFKLRKTWGKTAAENKTFYCRLQQRTEMTRRTWCHLKHSTEILGEIAVTFYNRQVHQKFCKNYHELSYITKIPYFVIQRHYRHKNWNSKLQISAAGKCCLQYGHFCFLICYPSHPLWSSCLLFLTDVERTDSSRLLYSLLLTM
jgi:hypothetical protein